MRSKKNSKKTITRNDIRARTQAEETAASGNAAGWGRLYIVATPIGNLEDITFRAIRVLKEAALIASEDTRHTRKLLTHYGISTPLFSYYKGKEVSRTREILKHLESGRDVALVSDAGTPCISDPGSILVSRAREAGVRIIPVPGPSALCTAISASGFSDTAFLFIGFLPARSNHRRQTLAGFAGSSAALIFYESPHRILNCLADCLEVLGDRKLFLARELTKIHEELLEGQISQVLASLTSRTGIKGEFVVMVKGAVDADVQKADKEDLTKIIFWHRDQGYSMSGAVRKIASEMNLSRSSVYQKALDLWNKTPE